VEQTRIKQGFHPMVGQGTQMMNLWRSLVHYKHFMSVASEVIAVDSVMKWQSCFLATSKKQFYILMTRAVE
jgi:hypothetical protein